MPEVCVISAADVEMYMKLVCIPGVWDRTSSFRRRKGLRKSVPKSPICILAIEELCSQMRIWDGLFSWRGSIKSQGTWLHAYLRFSSCCLPSRQATQSASPATSSRPPMVIPPASITARLQTCGLGSSPSGPSLSFASSTRSSLKRASGLAIFLGASSWFYCCWSSAPALPP